MQILKTVKEVRDFVDKNRKEGKTIGLVPTMGYLHEGHASLIRKSAEENDVTIVSVFVNPTQFGVNEDLDAYPRDLKHDTEVASEAGADVIFNPEVSEMYPKGYCTFTALEGEITGKLCGKSRPTHFRGVATVVLKLFNIAEPDRAYFGQKDAQQLAVIRQMVKDLNLRVEIRPCPIVREADGLAKSSRNSYLSEEERAYAVCLSSALRTAENAIKSGLTDCGKLKEIMAAVIEKTTPMAEIDYIETVDADTMADVPEIRDNTLIAMAVKFPSARLIDNVIIHTEN